MSRQFMRVQATSDCIPYGFPHSYLDFDGEWIYPFDPIEDNAEAVAMVQHCKNYGLDYCFEDEDDELGWCLINELFLQLWPNPERDLADLLWLSGILWDYAMNQTLAICTFDTVETVITKKANQSYYSSEENLRDAIVSAIRSYDAANKGKSSVEAMVKEALK